MRSYPKISESQLEHYSHHQSTSPAMKSNHDRQATHVRRYEVLTAFHKLRHLMWREEKPGQGPRSNKSLHQPDKKNGV